MIAALIYLVIYIIIIGLIVWLLLYLIDVVPLPEPFNRVAKVAVIVVSVLIIILLLLQLIEGGGMPRIKLGELEWQNLTTWLIG